MDKSAWDDLPKHLKAATVAALINKGKNLYWNCKMPREEGVPAYGFCNHPECKPASLTAPSPQNVAPEQPPHQTS